MWQSAQARPFAVQTVKPAVEEREEAAHDGVARLAAAVEHTRRRDPRYPALGLRCLTGSHRQRGRQDEAAGERSSSRSFTAFSFLQTIALSAEADSVCTTE